MLKIVKAELDDIKPCFELYTNLLKDKYFALSYMIRDEEIFVKRFKKIVKEGLPWVVAKENDGEVVGFVSIQPIVDNELWKPITELSIYVSEKYVGKNLASKILNKAFTIAKARGVKRVISRIIDANSRSVNFHKKNGFKQVGCLEEVLEHEDLIHNLFFFEKRLDKDERI